MRYKKILIPLLIFFASAASAEIPYDKIESGNIIQNSIGLGIFNKPLPLPDGQWKITSQSVTQVPLVNSRTQESSGSVSKYDFTLLNSDPGSPLSLMAVSITEKRTNVEYVGNPCVGNGNTNQWFKSLNDNSSYSGVKGCSISGGILNFRKIITNAASSNNPWVKTHLNNLEDQADTLPDNVVTVSMQARRDKSLDIGMIFFIRQEANLTDPSYENYLKSWINGAGSALVATLKNEQASIPALKHFNKAETSNTSQGTISNQYTSPFHDAIPLKDIVIKNNFDFVDISSSNLAETLQKCIPQFNGESNYARLPPATAVSATYTSPQSSRAFVIIKSKGLCIYRSSAGFPIFAGEEFLQTVTPTGAPKEIINQWNVRIADLIAKHGVARVAYVLKDGTAYIARYWTTREKPLELKYVVQQKPLGEWEKQDLDARFIDPGLEAVMVKNVDKTGEGTKALPF